MQKAIIEKLPKSKVKLTVTIPFLEVEKYTQKAARDYSKANRIDGFRPGKAPVSAVAKKIGEKNLLQKAAELAVKEAYVNALIENKIAALGQPDITLKEGTKDKDLEFEAVVSVFPEIKLCNVRSLKFKKPDLKNAKVTSEEITKAINDLRKMRAKLITVNRASKEGDRVEIDFKLFVGGAPIEGGSSINHPLVIGDNKFIPGFEKELVGLTRDEKKKFAIDFPKDYYDQKLQGKKGEFEVKMKLVQEQELPKLDDDFVKNIGKFKDLAEFEKKIKDNLELEKEIKEVNSSMESLFNEIIAKSQVELPDFLIYNEKEKMFSELEANVTRIGLSLDAYLAQIKKTKEEIMKGWDGEAEKRLTISLAMKKIGEDEKIKASPKEIERKVKQLTSELKIDAKTSKEIDAERLHIYAESLLVNEQVINWLKKEILKVDL